MSTGEAQHAEEDLTGTGEGHVVVSGAKGRKGWGTWLSDNVAPFTKYGLLGCCVGAIVWFHSLSINAENESHQQIQGEAIRLLKEAIANADKRADKQAEYLTKIGEQYHAMELRSQLDAQRMQMALDEIRRVRVDGEATRKEVGAVKKAVESIEQ